MPYLHLEMISEKNESWTLNRPYCHGPESAGALFRPDQSLRMRSSFSFEMLDVWEVTISNIREEGNGRLGT